MVSARAAVSRAARQSGRLTVPPADAKFAKALMLGISTLPTTNRFSRGLPPRTMMSLRKSLEPMTTPGRACTERDTSCRAAALFEDLSRLHQEARVLHLFRRPEGGRGHGDGLLEVLHRAA
jgi:hypothetical protein